MKCELNPNIKSISGKVGGMLFKTYKRPNGKTETRMYFMPRKKNGKYGYTRTTRVTDKEKVHRSLFAQASAMVSVMTDEEKQRYHTEWQKAKYMFNGKKYASFRGYIVARLYADLKTRNTPTEA
jgi:hypothetical protein